MLHDCYGAPCLCAIYVATRDVLFSQCCGFFSHSIRVFMICPFIKICWDIYFSLICVSKCSLYSAYYSNNICPQVKVTQLAALDTKACAERSRTFCLSRVKLITNLWARKRKNWLGKAVVKQGCNCLAVELC